MRLGTGELYCVYVVDIDDIARFCGSARPGTGGHCTQVKEPLYLAGGVCRYGWR